MNSYLIGQERLGEEDISFQAALEAARAEKIRPLCPCRMPGVPMYIAQVAGRLIVKRMPNSGGDHAPACDSFEPPAELSGLGEVMGTAIQEDPDEGLTSLKLDFSLTKIGSRSAPVPAAGDSDSVKTDGNKLTLRSTLHFLWEQAGFNRWSPAMQGRRTWPVIRKFLLQAAEGKVAKGASLSESIYIPEVFNAQKKDEIAGRRMNAMGKLRAPDAKGARRLMIVIGEVKDLAASRYGHKVVFKHVPEFHFMMNPDLHTRLTKRFAVELGLWDAFEDTHMMAIGTFGIGATGLANLEEMALMPVTANWIPFETSDDKALIDAMTHANRRFSKGLRYNLSERLPLACLVAADTPTVPTAMYITPPTATDDYRKALAELQEDSKLASWTWNASNGQMPELPRIHA